MDFDPLLGLDEDYLLERESRLSDSILWTLQRRFFEDTPDCFSSGVLPMFATTNAFIARAYAELIYSFALDCASDEPLTIIEVGAGHGQFGFLCLTALLARMERHGTLPIRYVLSDFTEHSLTTWTEHPKLAGLLRSGILDMACFDVERDSTLRLRGSGECIGSESPCGPMVVIANYVFDGLIQDAFQIRSGLLQEGRVTLVSEEPWPEVSTPGLLGSLSALFTFSLLPEADVYADPALNSVLDFYKKNLGDGAFGMPVGAIRCLKMLQSLSAGPVMVLSSDKAHNHLHQLQGQSAPTVTSHGSISMMANHDAMGRYVVDRGGQVLLSSARSGELETAAFLLEGAAGRHTCLAFESAIERFSPSDFLELSRLGVPGSLAGCLKVLQLAGWDPRWLCDLIPILRVGLPQANADQRAELLAGLRRAEGIVFPIGGEDQQAVIASLIENLVAA